MKGVIRTILLIALICIFSIQFTMSMVIFTDLDNHWGKEHVNWAANTMELIDGFNDGTFRPDDIMTRIDFILALNTLLVKKNIYQDVGLHFGKGINISYTDVDRYHWAYGELAILATYISEYGNADIEIKEIFTEDTFNPNKPINRHEVLLLSRAVTTPPIEDHIISFKDVDANIPNYNLIIESVNNGILRGYSDGTLRLDKNITRAEAATVLRRVATDVNYLADKFLVYEDIKSRNIGIELPIFQQIDEHESQSQLHQRFIDAITSIQYSAFVGHIPYHERHLYDMQPIETLWGLKNQNYYNVIGNNYYLIKYDKDLVMERKKELVKEGLQHLKLNVNSSFDGLISFLSIAAELLPMEETMNAAEATFRQSDNSKTKLETGLFIMSQYMANNEMDKGLNIHRSLLEYEFADDIKAQIIRNYGYLLYSLKGADEAIRILKDLKDEMDLDFNELNPNAIEFTFNGLMKQILIQSKN
ncbi:S-layer homology domain-containing protein [Alkaliphilus peptidifermentans]|uniref:Protein kinase domain-containing protein n=1 Tax=Alkaliphilus peptidifermentans DSM 18978 TaxID=1120976 RepID=A0A1G5CFS5_9FIRM|nr:S-layer homology domain-containing protein [Alkaliphilus peptidifermentans]SCY01174.1 Protein kinase domain-containing protein [Alkaliphilus peptidifermentans DSM 18978]